MKNQKKNDFQIGKDLYSFIGILCFLLISLLALTPLEVNASTVFIDNFEDGDALGWQETIVSGYGGTGSTGVELHGGSQMAFVYHRGEGKHSLSHDFDYVADNILSFDMHAVATIGYNFYGNPLHSNTGVVISFLNFLNNPLGKLTILNATNPASMGPDIVTVDSTQHNYKADMSDFAAQAGLGAGDPISKITLDFFATADFYSGGNIYPNGASSAKVWIDNVSITTVHIPPPPKPPPSPSPAMPWIPLLLMDE